MKRIKYVRTENDEIIVFSELLNHSDFKKFNPISAGFISIGVNKEGNPSCNCYGSSYTLNMESKPEEDTELAKRQLGMLDW